MIERHYKYKYFTGRTYHQKKEGLKNEKTYTYCVGRHVFRRHRHGRGKKDTD